MGDSMTIEMFPLNELPYDAYSKLLTTHKSYLKPFVPTKMSDDLKSGDANALVYWYPVYIITLYNLSMQGISFEEYLNSFNERNYWVFIDLFADTTKKLDKLVEKKLNENILGETGIIKGRLK
jgi:hypothetical protein